MLPHMNSVTALLGIALLSSTLSLSAIPEAFEVGPSDTAKLPKGKEADGIIGDFVLRNDKVEALISHNAPLRRANMSTFYGADGITPGCLYDLTLLGADNDQIVAFTPSGQQGRVSWVRIAKTGQDGEAVIETVITAVNNNGLYKRHEYRVRDGWQGLLIVTTLRNEGAAARKGTVEDRWTKFASTGKAGNVTWADAEDPADKAGYAYAWVEQDDLKTPPREVNLLPGEEVSFARFLAVGRSPAEAIGEVHAFLGPTAEVRGKVTDAAGKPLLSAWVEIPFGKTNAPAYPDTHGAFRLRLPAGDYEAAATDIGRNRATQSVKVDPRLRIALHPLEFKLEAASAIAFDIRDDTGKSIPCKAQFHGVGGTKNPNLGPKLRAHGCVDQYHSAKGQFTVQVPAGDYEVIVTRGIEFSHLKQQVKVAPGKAVSVKGTLKRLVDTRGWVSADYHNHSTPSGDNTCGTPDRLINLAAEHIEFAPTTEHNRLFDWRPTIQRLGLAGEIQTVSGMELTGSGAHFNSFPFEPEPFTQDNGAPVWNRDPRITAVTLRNHQGENPNRWIQINHPDMVENFIDRDGDGRADGGFMALGQLIDGYETQNYSDSKILGTAPFSIGRGRDGKEAVIHHREFIWLQLMNRGQRLPGMAVCDAHAVYGNGVGGWRMYLPSSSDEPAKIDWRENARHAKAGRSYLTTGPFLQVTTEDGHGPGDTVRASESLTLKVRVQCADWLDIDRVQVLVNGRQQPDLNYTRQSHPAMFKTGAVKFDERLTVPLSEDSHIIVVAIGENSDLKTGYGTSDQAKNHPCAYHNPIWVDTDGGGFTANGDTLGWPLPVKKMSVTEVKTMLQGRLAK
jgi:hypothetical protein